MCSFLRLAIRLLDGRITTLLEARALTLFAVNVSIKSASWGYEKIRFVLRKKKLNLSIDRRMMEQKWKHQVY
jgi:hypothetical protein